MSELISTNELLLDSSSKESLQEVPRDEEPAGGLGMLGIHPNILIAQFINFALVLVVLWKWVYQPLVKLLDERTKRIEISMQHTQEIEEKMKILEEEQTKLINQAKSEAAVVLEQAREQADLRKKELLNKAKEEVQQVVVQGKDQLQLEKQQMLREAKTELVEIAVLAARKILQESVDEKTSQKMARSVIEKMV